MMRVGIIVEGLYFEIEVNIRKRLLYTNQENFVDSLTEFGM